MFAPKYVGISQGYIRDNPGYVLFSGVENVRPQISLGFPNDMLGIFHFKITHKHVTFDLKMQRQTEAAGSGPLLGRININTVACAKLCNRCTPGQAGQAESGLKILQDKWKDI
jgi:hypothetical protein